MSTSTRDTEAPDANTSSTDAPSTDALVNRVAHAIAENDYGKDDAEYINRTGAWPGGDETLGERDLNRAVKRARLIGNFEDAMRQLGALHAPSLRALLDSYEDLGLGDEAQTYEGISDHTLNLVTRQAQKAIRQFHKGMRRGYIVREKGEENAAGRAFLSILQEHIHNVDHAAALLRLHVGSTLSVDGTRISRIA